MTFAALPDLVLEPLVRAALMEDLGSYGDITTRTVIPAGTTYKARINARETAIVSGMQVAALAFRLVDQGLEIKTVIQDGTPCHAGDTLMEITGDAAAILSGERVALNLAGRLTGIATLTAALVAETKGTKARITCTRKTTPGLRIVEKQAVLHGGGFNHRYSLSDAILIKDNHIAAAGGIKAVLEATKAQASHMMKVEIEVDTLAQLEDVLSIGGADVVLLDNMSPDTLRRAVDMINGRLVSEASGNVKRETVAEIAATGVDYISSGALTHSYRTIDLGLDF
ncbi:carboxylating nicotinate-nucleotide diphosphorylase [Epibacterium ulvae]|uniref:carboxylating nicotinate-nucleotide diphosphorylase n=1 Tax=Epibacterium ulvae TaxID=1156985 RepID=UPI0024929E34|nr:carboxylating nicotinate-nucleotide diphosphorylase [Epibacterium ulvae]